MAPTSARNGHWEFVWSRARFFLHSTLHIQHSTFWSLKIWLQLFRAPNLFTVPGDPLAGFLLASGGQLGARVLLPIAAGLALYGAGLLLNDLFDLEEDRIERPERPLPSGGAEPRVVRCVAIVLLVVGNALALFAGVHTLLVALGLTGAVLAYDAWAKRVPLLGALVMGLCRGLSLLLGATAAAGAPPRLVFVAAAITTLYIAAVTNLARYETRAGAPLWAGLLPPVPLAAGIAAFVGRGGSGWQYPGPATFALALAFVVLEVARLCWRPAPPLPPAIGSLIRALLFLQAAYCLTFRPSAPAFVCALLLIALWPVSYSVSRRFYAS